MISFKEFWVLLENRQYMYSWMAPNGNIYPNESDEIHADTAKELMVRFNIRREPSVHIYDNMFKAGWMRISYVGDTLYCNNTKMVPNDSQKRNLKRIAEQNRIREIVFDNDTNERTLWRSDDF